MSAAAGRRLTATSRLDAGEELLAAVLAARWSGQRLDELASLGRQATTEQWVASVSRHGLCGVVLKCHEDALGQLPQSYRSAVQQLHSQRTSRALLLFSELTLAHRALSTAGVVHVPLKGHFLSLQLYDDLAVRDCVDIDLLVDPADFQPAYDALCGAGFQPGLAHDGSLAMRRLILRSSHHLVFQSPRGVQLELHWRNEPSASRSLPPLSQFVDSLPRLRCGPVTLPVLEGQRLRQAVADHALRSCCYLWKWGYDVLALQSRSPMEAGGQMGDGPAGGHWAEDRCVEIMRMQLGLQELPGASRPAGIIGRHGVLNRRELFSDQGLTRPERLIHHLERYRISFMLERSLRRGLMRLWSHGFRFAHTDDPAMLRLVARIPLAAPFLRVWKRLRQDTSLKARVGRK